jgi:hypothetical protein
LDYDIVCSAWKHAAVLIFECGSELTTLSEHKVEDRVLTNLTRDPGKLAIYDQDLDGHSYNTIGYWPDKCNAILPLTGDQAEDAKAFQKAVDDGNKEAKALRQDSKPITFKLALNQLLLS